MASGGYRKPSNPSPVALPGALSRRTDGGPAQVVSTVPGQDYGDAKQQAMQQQTAPMAGTPNTPSAPSLSGDGDSAAPGAPQYGGGPFNGPSSRPNEPVTHGVPVGPGGSTEALTMGPGASGAQIAPATGAMTQLLTRLSGTDTTGILADLLQNAAARGA